MHDAPAVLGGSILALLLLLVGFGGAILWLISIIWAYGDAEKRGKSGCLIAIVVALLSWPLGLILWIALRPPEE